jgi:hypothetical protein
LIGPGKLIKKQNKDDLIFKCITRKDTQIFRLLMNFTSILGFKFNPTNQTNIYALSNLIFEDYSNNYEEIIFELIELGILPPNKNSKYYNYYNSIRILYK